MEPAEKDIMNKKPNDSKKSIFADGLWEKIFVEGFMIGILTLFAFSLGNKLYGLEVGRTMAFISLSMLELIHSFNVRSEESLIKAGLFKNKYLIGAFLIGTILQVGVVIIPKIAGIFDVVPLNSKQWIYTAVISILPLAIVEMQKKINIIKIGKPIYRTIER